MTATKMNGANALLESLERQGVKHVFGILGGAILPVYDALYTHPKIRHILARHEQGAVHAAEGYARASGRPGVCFATSGPGATNLVTGIANAYMDSSPVIALTGQVPTAGINSTYMIGKDAFYIATTGRPGPVLIDFPKDIQAQTSNVEWTDKIDLRGYKPPINPHPL